MDYQLLSDHASEKYVLSALYNFGYQLFITYSSILREEIFTNENNKIFFACLNYAYTKLEVKNIDIGIFHSVAKDMGLNAYINEEKNARHFATIINFPVQIDNVDTLVKKIRNLYLARKQIQILDLTKEKIYNISGNEETNEILSLGESDLLDFSLKCIGDNKRESNVFSDIENKFIEHISRKDDEKWISTGFPKYDEAIGGGLRPATVSVIGAFYKTGKSMLGMNIGYNVALSQVPVLYLDTEMTTNDFKSRFYSKLTGSRITDIERGKLDDAQKKISLQKVQEVNNKNFIFDHYTISHLNFESQFMEIRRWIHNKVGIGNKCLIIYDYLKMTSGDQIKNMQEYQMLGLLLTDINNFALKYNIPFLAFVQLNEQGETAASARIKWFCSNYSVFKQKSDEELALDAEINGTHKLFPQLARHGEGMRWGDYINIKFDKKCASMIEGQTKFEIEGI